jgi:AraC-like DNA-binding protein
LEPFSKLPTLPFLGDPAHRQTTHDAQLWAESVCVSTPVRLCEPLANGKGFWFNSAVINIGDVLVVSTQGSAITLSTEQHHSAQLLLPYQGLGTWKIERDVFANSVGESILYLPQAPLFLENDVTSGVALNYNPVVLIRAALTMAGPSGLSAQRLAVFGQPKQLLCSDPIAGPLIQSLYSIMHSLDQLSTAISNTAEMLRLDDILIRMAVLLLLPELIEADSRDSAAPFTALAARRRLQPLLDWIDANLNQAIALTDLEARAQMSRRNLQYTFKRAYDCTPMQWLRRRRLDLAMQRLKEFDRSVAVTSISRELGFLNSATFSREFRRQFGCSPSSVRRLRT